MKLTKLGFDLKSGFVKTRFFISKSDFEKIVGPIWLKWKISGKIKLLCLEKEG